MVDITGIRYRDIDRDEERQRKRLAARLGQLNKIEEIRKTLSSTEREERDRIRQVLKIIDKGVFDKKDVERCESLFVGARDLFNASPGLLGGYFDNHDKGVLKVAQASARSAVDALAAATQTADKKATAAEAAAAKAAAAKAAARKAADAEAAAVKVAATKADAAQAAEEAREEADVAAAKGGPEERATAQEAARKAVAAKTDADKAATAKTEAETAAAEKATAEKAASKEAEDAKDDAVKSATEQAEAAQAVAAHGSLVARSSCKAALTIGLLMVDDAGAIAPVVIENPTYISSKSAPKTPSPTPIARGNHQIVADVSVSGWASLSRMFFKAIGEAQSMIALAMLVLPLLEAEGDPNEGDGKPGTVDAAEFARVMRALVDKGVTADEPQLRRRINESLNVIQNRNFDGSDNELGIDLPDFEDAAEASIVPDNVKATGVFLCGAMFEELKVFEVIDKLVELFQNGMLTRTGSAGERLYKYWKDTPNRMSDGERRKFYAMTMGIPGGDGAGMVNREFNDLWLRFVSSVSSFVRQNDVEKLLRAPVPAAISQQQVRKAARDLAVNLSMHGYGMTFHAARDLQSQIKFMINLLSDPEIRSNYGAGDMWQVVDQVATLELGGAKTSSRYRVLATCGAIITAWLATNVGRITRSDQPIIDMDEVRLPTPRTDGSKATTTPTDWDLVNACELWLADTGTGDTIVDQMSQPRETPVMTSRPVQIPAIAREMLADLPGMGLGYPQH